MDKQQSEIPNEIRSYLEGLLNDAKMTMPDDEVKEEMIKELYARLDSFLATKIVENMPTDALDEFIRLNEEKKPQEEIQSFIKKNMPNSEEVFRNAFIDFRSLYLGGVTVAKNAPNADE